MGIGIQRIGDISVGTCNHGGECCPHEWVGVRVQGSPNVYCEGSQVARIGDIAITTCPHCGLETAIVGSATVLANGIGIHRIGDTVVAEGGTGTSVSGAVKTFSG